MLTNFIRHPNGIAGTFVGSRQPLQVDQGSTNQLVELRPHTHTPRAPMACTLNVSNAYASRVVIAVIHCTSSGNHASRSLVIGFYSIGMTLQF